MSRYLFYIVNFLAIPFVLFVVALNLLHPFLHAFEGGSLDAMLPMLNLAAISAGGGSIVDWARRIGHRHKHHDGEDCDL